MGFVGERRWDPGEMYHWTPERLLWCRGFELGPGDHLKEHAHG